MLEPTEPWHISWQAFGILYGLGLALIRVLAGLARRRGRPGALPSPLPELGIEQLAYLYGGASRVADAVVARLLSQRKLRARPGVGIAAGRRDARTTGLATRAFAAARKKPQRPGDLSAVLEKSAEMSQIVEELRGHGLVSPARVRLLRKWGPHTLLLAWLVLGIARFVAELPPRDASPATLVPALLIGGMLFVGLFLDDSSYLTPAGAAVVRALDQAREGKGEDASTDEVLARYGPLLQGAAGAVVVSGLSSYPDPDVRAVLSMGHLERGGGGV